MPALTDTQDSLSILIAKIGENDSSDIFVRLRDGGCSTQLDPKVVLELLNHLNSDLCCRCTAQPNSQSNAGRRVPFREPFQLVVSHSSWLFFSSGGS